MPLPALGRRASRGAAARAAAACALAASCATGGPPAGPAGDANPGMVTSTRVAVPQGTLQIDNVVSAASTSAVEVNATADRAFAQLAAVYEELGVPINTVSSQARTVGARDARVPRRLGQTPLSRYVGCGRDAVGVDRADSYAVTLTALSRVSPTGGADAAAAGAAAKLPPRSTVVTQVAATAQSISVSGQPVQCGSTGRLERAIEAGLQARLAAAPAPPAPK